MDTSRSPDLNQLRQNAEAAEQLLKNLANANRLLILCHLVEGECGVGELEAVVGLSQSALSQHLARLREQGLVSTRREGTNIYYSLAEPKVHAVLETLYRLYCAPSQD